MGFDRNGNVSLTNPDDITPQAPTSYIPAVSMGAPGPIGGTTASSGAFTSVTVGTTLAVTGAATFSSTITASGAIAFNETSTFATTKKLQFRDTGLFINSSVDGQLDIDADAELEITSPIVDIDASNGVDISHALVVGTLLSALGLKVTPTARTATADGTTTGTIGDTESWITAANGGDANNIIKLPTPTPGRVVVITTTGALEVRSSTPASIGINGGTGASAESALPAGCIAVFFCLTATAWLAFQMASNGDLTKVEVAAQE